MHGYHVPHCSFPQVRHFPVKKWFTTFLNTKQLYPALGDKLMYSQTLNSLCIH
jgi:hypothetical protein